MPPSNAFEELTDACYTSLTATRAFLAEHPTWVDARDPGDGETALQHFAAAGRADLVTTLLDHGADPELLDANGDSPLLLACSAGHTAVVRVLLERGVSVEPRDSMTGSPLWCAARSGDLDCLRTLLRGTGELFRGDERTFDTVMGAVSEARTDVLDVLAAEGIDLGCVEVCSMTVFHYLPDDDERARAVVATLARHGVTPRTVFVRRGLDDYEDSFATWLARSDPRLADGTLGPVDRPPGA